MSGITFRYLISLAVQNRLSMQLMDVVTAYLYGSLDSEIYMKIPEEISIPDNKANRNMYCVKLQKSLKQSDRMWYNRLSEFLKLKGYTNNDDCPCVFIKKSSTGFCIISVYVDDLNIIGNGPDINEARHHLKTEFEMKDLGQTKFCLGLQLEHFHSGIFIYQAAYVQKILEKFNMDKSYPTKTPMVVRSLDIEKDPFRPREEEEEEILGPHVPYLSVIGALMYLANSTRPDIAFAVNLLARHSAAPTKRHWYVLKPAQRITFCKYLRSVKFPDGFAANLGSYITADGSKVQGRMKTHSCHVLLQRIIPAGLRGLVRPNLFEAVAELGNFFRDLCSRNLSIHVVQCLKQEIPLILCKLEKIFPPTFFDVMVHLVVHLPDEALLRGPVQYG